MLCVTGPKFGKIFKNFGLKILDTQYKIFFCLKKIYLQTLVEIILDIIKFFLEFWDPLGPPYKQNENFYIWGVKIG